MAEKDDKTSESSKNDTPESKSNNNNKETSKKDDSPSFPPVEAAARRLERLLGGGTSTSTSSTASGSTSQTDSSIPPKRKVSSDEESTIYTNPSKIVRRWLGTSSGTSGRATLKDLSNAAMVLLDPNGVCGEGRELLLGLGDTVIEKADGGMMDVDEEKKEEEKMEESATDDSKPAEPSYLHSSEREVEAWLLSIATRILFSSSSKTHLSTAYSLSTQSIGIITSHIEKSARHRTAVGSTSGNNSSGLFPLLARTYRYRSLVVEGLGGGGGEERRREMAMAYRMACLRRDVDCQSTLLNLMLRDLLNSNQVEQAQKLLSNSTFPDSASNNQLCRYLYHSGRIQALRLEYTSAFSNLSQCLRKSPTNTGLGFRIASQRLLVVVQLLMGEIPERSVFFSEGMRGELEPYMRITQAVRRGDLAVFQRTVEEYAERLRLDGTFTLISRLAHSVVKAGLRKLNVSYSRISLEDVAKRLGLPSKTSAEFVVAKAVRDGVIDATIDHKGGYVQSHDLVDVYATTEPAEAFHRRIVYCLTTHNDALRGMRYPPDAYKKQLEASRGMRGRRDDDDKTDEEKAQELEDELDDEY